MNFLVLTGAGISAESGVPTFRDANGLWEGHRPEDVASPRAFARDPTLVHRFYNTRRNHLLRSEIKPNCIAFRVGRIRTIARRWLAFVLAGYSKCGRPSPAGRKP